MVFPCVLAITVKVGTENGNAKTEETFKDEYFRPNDGNLERLCFNQHRKSF